MSDEAGNKVEVLGRELKCLVCGHDRFSQRAAQLETDAATLNLEFLHRSGVCIICRACGYIHWFYPQA